jgi:hypothetical protein
MNTTGVGISKKISRKVKNHGLMGLVAFGVQDRYLMDPFRIPYKFTYHHEQNLQIPKTLI